MLSFSRILPIPLLLPSTSDLVPQHPRPRRWAVRLVAKRGRSEGASREVSLHRMRNCATL
eukprot:4883171-Pyramimonas_sp.AAC.1